METRDQWYKPNLLYNIHWRPPKKQEAPDMIVKTVRFNPSVCTCGEHNCGPHYRMERKVVWINKETTNTENKEVKSDPFRRLPIDRENVVKEGEDLRSKEENIREANCENESNGKNRCMEGEEDDIEITKEGLNGDGGTRLETDDKRKSGKNNDSAESEGLKCHKDEIGDGKKVWCAKDEENSFDCCNTGYSDMNVDLERSGEGKVSTDGGGLKVKGHRRTGENMSDDNYKDNLKTDEYMKNGDAEYLIRIPDSLKSKYDGENGGRDFKESVVNDDGDSDNFNSESKRTEHELVLHDNFDGEKVGEDLNSGCNFSVEDNARNDDLDNCLTDNRERCNVHYTNCSDDDCDGDITEEIYQDEEISPAFGIMAIYCSGELHYTVQCQSAVFTEKYKGI